MMGYASLAEHTLRYIVGIWFKLSWWTSLAYFPPFCQGRAPLLGEATIHVIWGRMGHLERYSGLI